MSVGVRSYAAIDVVTRDALFGVRRPVVSVPGDRSCRSPAYVDISSGAVVQQDPAVRREEVELGLVKRCHHIIRYTNSVRNDREVTVVPSRRYVGDEQRPWCSCWSDRTPVLCDGLAESDDLGLVTYCSVGWQGHIAVAVERVGVAVDHVALDKDAR